MLVLSRKKGESIQIADGIIVTIADVRGGRVRLSIDAPRSVRICRSELLERIFNEPVVDEQHCEAAYELN